MTMCENEKCCVIETPAGICRGMNENRAIIREINEMAEELRAILFGPKTERNSCICEPECMMDDVKVQREMLGEAAKELKYILDRMRS